MPNAVRPNISKHGNLEQRKIYCKDKQEEQVDGAQKPQTPWWSGGVFYDKIWGEGCRVCDSLLIGWWWGNRVVLQESPAQPEVGGGGQGRDLVAARELKLYA